ncbi:hypothetical protein [Pandoraea sp.]|nr:hypothetical protein [Pandoraea sp.]
MFVGIRLRRILIEALGAMIIESNEIIMAWVAAEKKRGLIAG